MKNLTPTLPGPRDITAAAQAIAGRLWALGPASKDDVERLEARLADLENAAAKKSSAKPKPSTKAAATK